MAVTESKLIRDFVGAIKDGTKEKTKAYETPATVTRIEDGTAWVHVPGGVEETPVQLTINATEGDTVRVRVANGRATIVGNVTNPPTDDATAKEALSNANSAIQSAKNASIAAASAESSAAAAKESATEAKRTTDEINAYADTAGKTVTQILHDGETAGTAAEQAKTDAASAKVSAENASEYAARALGNLSTVQSVTETLNWITAHGTMTLTTDTELDPTHVYFVADQNGDYVVGGNHYSVVTEPNVDDIATYYELGIDESLNNYVATHLSLTSEGLWLIKDGSGYKLKLTNYGSYIVAPDGTTVVNQNTADGNIIRALDGTVIAHFGYGEGVAQSGRSEEPYYILGKKATTTAVYDSTNTYKTGSLVLYGDPQELYVCIKEITTPESWNSSHWQLVIGNYSVAEGYETKASGWASHAEGNGSTASGSYSHAEGAGKATGSHGSHAEGNSTASGNYSSHAEGFGCTASGEIGSHAEGYHATASGRSSHAEGDTTTASGHRSHAQNRGTEAGYQDQTAIGRYNDNQRGNAFEIGNGTSNADRSNAFTVGWDGNVELALDTTATSGTDKDIYDALVSLGWTDVIV